MADSQQPSSDAVPPPPQPTSTTQGTEKSTPTFTPTPATVPATAVNPGPSNTPDPNNTSTSTIRTDDDTTNNDVEMTTNTSITARPDVTMSGTSEAATSAANGTNNTNMVDSQQSMVTATTTSAGGVPTGFLDTEVNPVSAVAVLPPSKKDTSLREFLGQMDEYAPIIPDAVTAHYLTLAGLPPPGNGPNQTPPHLARLLALATQKFIADIAADAYQYSRIRSSNSSSSNNPMGAINLSTGLPQAVAGGGAGSVGAGGAVAAGGAGGAGGAGEGTKGKGGTSGLHLGVQRPGFGGGGQGGQQGRTVLTMEDLGMAVAEYGVSVKRGEFYR
ncbi:hypothetical protein PABG_04881 [Paracoccidioides brasiliensis Pb03]|nr:hypothetical protein PABG_04881 [Paracoccidioides brasiliensis Pb03]ODH47822.1 hypothetical protein GX48_06088 [Paracoccidioides brasiliensis]